MNAEEHRVIDDPDLTADAVVYEVTSPDDRNPEYPVRYRLDLTGGAPVILTVDQPSPFWENDYEQIYIDLDTLEQLGHLATALKEQAR